MDNIYIFFNLSCAGTNYDLINKKYQIWITLIRRLKNCAALKSVTPL